ncbi:LLM class flavin-dependent oxidoreductase [Amycolatopsis alba]|uniref:LLM class flavin-dependent oxidoreductase n=1 Tax=Amycolatopsis alba TaxID=76020 RepID=UPI001FD7F407|nr:LLM class flavin-dependent oxidoreductase [Amycolatopsis alba]
MWVSEVFSSDAVSIVSWIAARTRRVDVGTAVMQIPARAPVVHGCSSSVRSMGTRTGPWRSRPECSCCSRSRSCVRTVVEQELGHRAGGRLRHRMTARRSGVTPGV